MILEKELWTDKSISFLISDIVEYDMKEAGFSIIKERNLLPQETIEELNKIADKKARQRKIGLLQRGIENKHFREELARGFKEYRLWFGEANGLDDIDILAIKKDAIFVKKFCYNTECGNHIRFVEKNVYTAFMQFGSFEFYLKENGLDVKGLLNDNLELHQKGMLLIIHRVMKLLSQYEDIAAIKYVVKVMNDYKTYQLPVECYREFNSVNGYRLWQNDQESVVKDVGESYKYNLIIDYNYINILVPLLNLVMG